MNFLYTIDLIEENLIKWWHFMHLFGVNWDRILHNSLPIWLDYSLIFASIFCREFQKSGPTEENWWIKCTMDPPFFGMDSKVGAAMVGSALICKKKIRINLLKISSKFVGHEMMRCHIYSPTNIAYMSRWMAKIQFKPNKEEKTLQKKVKPRHGTFHVVYIQVGSTCIQELHIKSEIQIWIDP